MEQLERLKQLQQQDAEALKNIRYCLDKNTKENGYDEDCMNAWRHASNTGLELKLHRDNLLKSHDDDLVCRYSKEHPEKCPYTETHNLVDCRYITPDRGCKYTSDVVMSINYKKEE